MDSEKKKTGIVIQFHNPEPNSYEIISLTQCVKLLGRYPFRFVIPRGLNIDRYRPFISGVKDFKIVEFSKKRYFSNIRGYNRLLTSLKFYRSFEEFDYILLHHLDAFVFKDDLEYWLNKEYDLIGPPMYEFNGTIHPENYIGVGTSGFSLKNVKSHIRVLRTFTIIYGWQDIIDKLKQYNWRGRLFHFPYFLRLFFGLGNNSFHLLNSLKLNDDIFWGILIPKKFRWFKVAGFIEASKFGLEYNCDKILNQSNGSIPFGCHLWYKGEFLEFWKEKIKMQGYNVQ